MNILNRWRGKISQAGWRGWLWAAASALIVCQMALLALFEGVFLLHTAWERLTLDNVADRLLARELGLDVDFLRRLQAMLPADARLLNFVDDVGAVRYHLYPRYAVHLTPRFRDDALIARDIARHRIDYVVIWDPTAYADSALLKDATYFQVVADDQRGHRLLRVVIRPPAP